MVGQVPLVLRTFFIVCSATLSAMEILRLSTAVPETKYSTEDLIDVFPCPIPVAVRQNILNLGVSNRHLVNQEHSQSNSETVMSEAAVVKLCQAACDDAVEQAGFSMEDIGCFIASYDVNPFLCPGLSHLLIRKLGFDPYMNCINVQGMACAAFTKTLQLAENHLAAHPEDAVLLCVSGVNSYWFQNQVKGLKNVMGIRQINKIKSRARRRMELRKWVAVMEFFLFGDGAAAAVVANAGEGLTVKKTVEVTNLEKNDYAMGYARLSALDEPFKFGFHSHLDKKIPELGVKYTDVALKRLLGKKSVETTKAAKWAVHTGSGKMLDALAEHHRIPREKIAESHRILREYGNLAGASLPFILKQIVSAEKSSEDRIILMLGYGWGFSASAAMLEETSRDA
jgi:predicted naringenin-chalcone synthase